MNLVSFVAGAVLGISCNLGLFNPCALGQVTRESRAESNENIVTESSISFQGTVMDVGKTSFKGVPAAPNNVILRVDQVLRKPRSISLKKGDLVTVVAKNTGSLKKGDTTRLAGEPWIIAEGVCLKEISHGELLDTVASSASVPSAGPSSENSHVIGALDPQTLKVLSNFAASDAAVIGKVLEIRPAVDLTAAGETEPISEHNPDMKEAIVAVQNNLRGDMPGPKQVVIRFPGSLDVAWSNIPKLKAGDEGVFLLKEDMLTGHSKTTLNGQTVTAYVLPNKQAILSGDQAVAIQQMINSVNLAHVEGHDHHLPQTAPGIPKD